MEDYWMIDCLMVECVMGLAFGKKAVMEGVGNVVCGWPEFPGRSGLQDGRTKHLDYYFLVKEGLRVGKLL